MSQRVEDILQSNLSFLFTRFIKEDGSLWFIRIEDENPVPINVSCHFNLNRVVCSTDKIAVTTVDDQIMIRAGCTEDCPEGGGWVFIEHK